MPPILVDEPYFPNFFFSLDLAGAASLLGGDDAVSAMAAVPVYENRRWLGWYNSPGSFKVAKRLNSLAISPPPNSHSIGTHVNLTALLEPSRSKWPKFRGTRSGTNMEETGYLAALFMKECAVCDSEVTVEGRKTAPVEFTIADLNPAPGCEMHPARSSALTVLIASVPIFVSVVTCVLSALWGDWFAMALIFVGMVASGLSGLALGSAEFVFTHPKPADGSPADHGLLGSDKAFVLLRGEESALNSITRGNFFLRFSSERHYNYTRYCSFLFFVQGITQLLLIPQASLPGQIVFLASLGVSALYNIWLSSLDKEKIHRRMFFEGVLEKPKLTKYRLGTYTTAVVFILLVLQLEEPNELLDELLPNKTQAWRCWKATILEWLRSPVLKEPSFQLEKYNNSNSFTQKDKNLLRSLFEDAESAYRGFKDHTVVESRKALQSTF